jgi:hypothetical protein
MKSILSFVLVPGGVFASGLAHNAALASGSEQQADAKAAELRVTELSPRTNRLGRTLTLKVTNLPDWLARAQANQEKIVLFVNGNELTNVSYTGMDVASNN